MITVYALKGETGKRYVGTVERTADVFARVVSNSGQAGGLIDEIAAASAEQAQGIKQLNAAVADMDKVVQQNAATAEESAASSDLIRDHAYKMQNKINMLSELIFDNQKKLKRSAPQEDVSPPNVRQVGERPVNLKGHAQIG